MAIKRMDHINITVDDLEAGIAFFKALGMEVEGQQPVSGEWLEKLNQLQNMKIDIALMKTPDGHGKVELVKFHSPALVSDKTPNDTPNTLGFRQIMFAVDSVEGTLADLRKNGEVNAGEIIQYENLYKLCYVRGPAGVLICLAEELF